MKILKKIIKKILMLIEFRNTDYKFTREEKLMGVNLYLSGYNVNPSEEIIENKDGFSHMKVGDCEVWVPENSFKAEELSWIYNEIFTLHRDNPHSYETDNLKINKGDYVIDAGACEGFFIRFALEKGAKKVFAFEPLKPLVNGLNLTYNKEISGNKLTIIDRGLSDTEDLIAFAHGLNNYSEARMEKSGDYKCKVTSLDHVVESGLIPQVDYIKMDIEGAEILAIKGAKKTIKKFKPKLSIAVYHEYETACIIKEMLRDYRPDYELVFGGCYTFEKPYRPCMLYAY